MPIATWQLCAILSGMYDTHPLSKMTPNEIIQAIREGDKQIIRKLVKEGLAKGVWTQSELAEMLEVNTSTISRWANHETK